jgi:integrase
MPRAPTFTDRTIKEKAKPGKLLHVSGTPNLYLKTSAKKKKQRWIVKFSRPRKRAARHAEKRPSNVTTKSLGPYPEVTIEMAKNRAEHARLILKRDKINPFETDWNEGATTTFGEVARKWVDSRDWTGREKQRHDTEYFLFTCAKELLETPLLKIRPKNIHEALRPLWKGSGSTPGRPKQVKRTLSRIENVFDFAKASHLYFAENPARWKEKQKHLFPRFSNDREHFDAMPYEDISEFMRVLRQREGNSVGAQALEFLILTATRSGEVRGMKRSELGPENLYWTIPAARMKASRDHIVPLSPRAREIVDWRLKHTIGDYVFSAHGRNRPLDEKAMRGILHKIKPGVTVHGFRSTFRDWAGDETDFPRDLIEECLSHQVGNAVERAYRRRSSLETRRKIMQAWASYCG